MPNKPIYPNFKNLEIGCKPLVDAYFRHSRRNVCEMSFATILIWKDYLRPQITFINDNLCIYIEPLNDKPYFLEPMGNKKIIHTLKTCLEFAGRID